MGKGKVLVTGGAGFIGSHIVDRLLEEGYEVTVLDLLLEQVHKHNPVDDEGWPQYLNKECRRVCGDILDLDLMLFLLKDADFLIHLAGSVGVAQSMTDPLYYTRNNTMGAATVLEALKMGKHNVQRMMVAGSISAYGEGAALQQSTGQVVYPEMRTASQLEARVWELFVDDEQLLSVPTPEVKPLMPQSIYALNMQDRETRFLIQGKAMGIPTASMRMFNVYGSRQALSNPYTGVLAIFASQFMNGNAPKIYEDGGQRRNFVHVADVAKAYLAFMESDKVMYETFNVGSPEVIQIGELASKVACLMGKPEIRPEITGKYRVGDIRHCYPELTKTRQMLGWEAKITLAEGLPEVIAWTQTQTAVDYNGANYQNMLAAGVLR